MPDGSSRIVNDLTIYDAEAARWWQDQPKWVEMLQRMVPGRLKHFDGLIDWQGKAVLDLGCAGGFMAEALAARGADVTGIDPAGSAIEAARAHAAAEGLRIRYDQGRGEALPYADASFDAVVSVDVLEHVDDLDRVLAEAARVLKPGGLFLFDTINRTWAAGFAVVIMAERVLGLLPRGAHDPLKFIQPSELRAAMRGAGLEPEGRFTGLGITGMDRQDRLTFGPMPGFTPILYMGSARKG